MTEQRRSSADATEMPNRRRFLGYLIDAHTLSVGVTWLDGDEAEAAVPTLPQPADIFDLGDLQNLAATPTSGLIAFFFQAEDGIRDGRVTGVQTCALPI